MTRSDGNYIDGYGHLFVNSAFIFTYLVSTAFIRLLLPLVLLWYRSVISADLRYEWKTRRSAFRGRSQLLAERLRPVDCVLDFFERIALSSLASDQGSLRRHPAECGRHVQCGWRCIVTRVLAQLIGGPRKQR